MFMVVSSVSLCSDVEKIQAGIGDKLSLFIHYMSTFFAGFGIAFHFSWKMALVMSAMLPILVTISAVITQVYNKTLPSVSSYCCSYVHLLCLPFRLWPLLQSGNRMHMPLLGLWQKRCSPPYELCLPLGVRTTKLNGD